MLGAADLLGEALLSLRLLGLDLWGVGGSIESQTQRLVGAWVRDPAQPPLKKKGLFDPSKTDRRDL